MQDERQACEPGALQAEKARTRAQVLQLRDALSADSRRQQSRSIMQEVLALVAFGKAKVVMAYCSFGSELDTSELIEQVHASGKTLALPKVNRENNCIDIYRVGPEPHNLKPGLWDIPEPDPATCSLLPIAELDFVLVPGLAFDTAGGRLGYGRGFYDKLLHAAAGLGAKPCLVAGAFDLQVVHSVPMESHDVAVHSVVTASRCIPCGPWPR